MLPKAYEARDDYASVMSAALTVVATDLLVYACILKVIYDIEDECIQNGALL
jgi:hypothetical protein